jgi:hypothetical protein
VIGCGCDPERAAFLESLRDQEPRTGGVLVRWDGGYGMFVPNSYGTQTHRVFTLAEAEERDRELAEAREETRVARQEGARACVAGFGFKRERDEARVQAEALIDRDTRDNEWAEAITAVFPWEIDGDEDVMGCVVNHVSNLASLYEEMIDPNDPAVGELVIDALDRERYNDLDGMADAVLAALRSKP